MPTPRKNLPGIIAATVAAACATIAGWMRMSGHVTPVPTRILSDELLRSVVLRREREAEPHFAF